MKTGNTSAAEDAFHKKYPVLHKLPANQGEECFTVWVRQRHFPDFRLQGPFGCLYIEYKGYPRAKWIDFIHAMSHEQKKVYRVVLQKRNTKHLGRPVTDILTQLGIQHSIGVLDPRWLVQVGLKQQEGTGYELKL